MTNILPEHKSKKYDRQIRLWGDQGQISLENAKVCLINANTTGTETLKNVILPGIGSFTIIDDQMVSGEDAGNNFFYDKESIGKPRAEVATTYLKELNPDVAGFPVCDNLEQILDFSSTYFDSFNIVIASSLPEKLLLRLANILWESDIPLLICKTFAFYGYIRLIIKEHTIIESHPDNTFEDLRLDRPFQTFVDHCNSIALDALSFKEHSHIPWLILLYKYLQKWQEENNGAYPSTYKEKQLIKNFLQQGVRKKEDGSYEMEENFEEAKRNVNTSLLPTNVPVEVQKILNDDSSKNLHSESKPFWILVSALNQFVSSQGNLPLRGIIPDMTSTTESYVALQNVYREKAALDCALLSSHVMTILQTLGRDEPLNIKKSNTSPANSPAKPEDCISDDDIKLFCKNAFFLRLLRTRSLLSEYDPITSKLADICRQMEANYEDCNLHIYMLMRAAERFESRFNRYPGLHDANVETDFAELKIYIQKICQDYSAPFIVKDEEIYDFCRCGMSELHSVAAFIGGTAGEEIIKIITKQFVPIDNTFLYNAINQTTSVYQF